MLEAIHLVDAGGASVLLAAGEYLVVIDTGIAGAPRNYIFPYMAKVGMDPKKIRLVLHTHGHFDHMGGTAEVKNASGALIAVHRLEASWVEDPKRQHEEYFNRYPEHYPTTRKDLESWLEKAGPGAKVDIRLVDGVEFDLDSVCFKIIHTPGHSPGSICIYDEGGGQLIGGDSVQAQGTVGFPFIYDGSAYIRSMKRLRNLRIEQFYAGHVYRPFNTRVLKGEDAYELIDESLRCAERIKSTVLDSLTDSPQSLDELQRKVAQAFNVSVQYRIILAVSSFLRVLEKKGEAESVKEQGRVCWRRR